MIAWKSLKGVEALEIIQSPHYGAIVITVAGLPPFGGST
jgi:hypothetical protein